MKQPSAKINPHTCQHKEAAAQTYASLQICFGPGRPLSLMQLPDTCFRSLEQMLPLVSHLLRPRRSDDAVAARYGLGPQRLEAFVRRPDEPLAKDVYKTLDRMMPFLPHFLDWADWEPRHRDQIEGMPTGGGIVSLRREVEVSPFVICVVLSKRHPVSVGLKAVQRDVGTPVLEDLPLLEESVPSHSATL